MGFPSEDEIASLKKADAGRLAELDACGLLMAPGESLEKFCERLSAIGSFQRELDAELGENGFVELAPGLPVDGSMRIPPELLREASERDWRLYGFRIDWVPGFFLSKGLGALWGGCAVSLSEGGSIFLIREAFKTRLRWLIYSRDEIVSHELCHVARTPLGDMRFEEHFAYQTSESALRRLLGNCFRRQTDALIFIGPIFLLFIVQVVRSFMYASVPALPFWIFALGAPLYLVARNLMARRVFRMAERALMASGCTDSMPVLFRCSSEEIAELSSLGCDPAGVKSYIEGKASSELRWEIIKTRFIG